MQEPWTALSGHGLVVHGSLAAIQSRAGRGSAHTPAIAAFTFEMKPVRCSGVATFRW